MTTEEQLQDTLQKAVDQQAYLLHALSASFAENVEDVCSAYTEKLCELIWQCKTMDEVHAVLGQREVRTP